MVAGLLYRLGLLSGSYYNILSRMVQLGIQAVARASYHDP